MPKRINESIRSHVIHKIIQTKFVPLEKELEDKDQAIAFLIYHFQYTEKERQLMDSLPAGWLDTTSRMRITVSGQYHEFILANDVRVPESHETCRIAASTPLGRVIRDHQAQKEALSERREEALRLARAALGSYRTVEALVKAWPEVEPFLPKEAEPIITSALAVPVKQLNNLLGLP